MSFQEKSAWTMLGAMVLVYGWYFVVLLGQILPLDDLVARDVAYRGQMLGTVLALVTLAVITHIVVAALAPADADKSDERDREINRIGEYVGGYVAAAAALSGMGMAMFEVEHFWIANGILAGLVLSEIVSGVIKVTLYRRGL